MPDHVPRGMEMKQSRYAREHAARMAAGGDATRMAASYPPRSNISQIAERRTQGAVMSHYGQRPANPETSSVVNYNHPGYDSTRTQRPPDSSPMGHAYRSYKNDDLRMNHLNREYNQEVLDVRGKSRRGAATQADFDRLGALAERRSAFMAEVSTDRKAYADNNVGRRTSDWRKSHVAEATNLQRGSEAATRRSQEHYAGSFGDHGHRRQRRQ